MKYIEVLKQWADENRRYYLFCCMVLIDLILMNSLTQFECWWLPFVKLLHGTDIVFLLPSIDIRVTPIALALVD